MKYLSWVNHTHIKGFQAVYLIFRNFDLFLHLPIIIVDLRHLVVDFELLIKTL